MAVSIEWGTGVISVEQSDLTLVSGAFYEYDLETFRDDLKTLEASEDGIVFPDTHVHNTEVTLGTTTFARIIEIVNGYTITFEDGVYVIDLINANSNIVENTNLNSVSLRANNSAGLIVAASSVTVDDVWTRVIGMSTAEEYVGAIHDMLASNTDIVENPDGTKTITVYEDDGTTVRRTIELSANGLNRTRTS